MTDEQIKQNAEAYADKAAPITEQKTGIPLAIHTAAEVAYIAGAHSRDEEIEELKEEIESLKENEKELFDGFTKRGTKLVELMKENVKLRNPWIKPSEQMPVDGDDIVYLLYEGKAGRMKYHSTYEKWLLESVTHWMKVTLKEDEQ